MKAFLCSLLVLVGLCCGLTQCGYQLGGIKPPALSHVETFKVNLFENLSLEPRAGVLMSSALAEAIQRDGTFKMSGGPSTDISINGTVRSISFKQLRSSREDTYESTELGLCMVVNYRVVDSQTSKVLMRGNVEETVSYYNVNNNVQTARTNALSYAARRIADRIAENLTNG